MHILEGFAKVFDALDQILKIIRASEGKADAAKKIMAKFKLDDEQTDAILELRLYRLARLEILVIQEELKEKKKRAGEIKKLLGEKRLAAASGASCARSSTRLVAGVRQGRQAPHAHRRGRRRAGVLRRRADRRRGQSRPADARRLGEAPERDQGSRRDAPARRRRGAGGRRGVDEARRVVFFSNFGTAYTSPHRRRPGDHRATASRSRSSSR